MGKKFLGLGGTDHFWDRAKAWILDQITSAVAAKIAEIVANAPEDLDTLKEIADWISAHADDAAAMNTQIQANTEAIAGKADKVHTHTKSQITDFPTSLKNPNALTVNGKTYNGSEAVDAGVQTVANGGTGATDAASGFNTLADGVRDSSKPADNEKMLLKPSGTWYKTTCLDFWNYIKGKISSVLGLTKDNYDGKAASAGNADTVDNYHASQLWRSDGATWNPQANVVMTPSGNNDEWSFDFRNKNGATGLYWQVWDENKSTLLRVNADDGKVSAPYGFVGNLSGKAATAGTADKVASAGASKMWIYGRAGAICKTTTAAGGGGWKTLASIKTASGSIEIGNLSGEDFIRVVYSSDADVNAGNNNVTQLLYIRRGNVEVPHEFIANSAKALSKMVIPIGAPSSPEDGCIWIER